MLDNLFSGTLIAGMAGLGAIAVLTAGASPPRPASPSMSAARPTPIDQLPRVVVRGNVMRAPALLAAGDAGMLPDASAARPPPDRGAALR